MNSNSSKNEFAWFKKRFSGALKAISNPNFLGGQKVIKTCWSEMIGNRLNLLFKCFEDMPTLTST